MRIMVHLPRYNNGCESENLFWFLKIYCIYTHHRHTTKVLNSKVHSGLKNMYFMIIIYSTVQNRKSVAIHLLCVCATEPTTRPPLKILAVSIPIYHQIVIISVQRSLKKTSKFPAQGPFLGHFPCGGCSTCSLLITCF